MTIELLDMDFAVCRLKSIDNIRMEEFTFLSATDEEISLVCPEGRVPADTEKAENGWRGFRIKGVLDFSLIGILSEISAVLAENNIGIFVVSTYNTDYIFVKRENIESALNKLREKGYTIE